MKYFFIRLIRKFNPFAFLQPEGDKGIEAVGHRRYIGGNRDESGALQFDFLVSKGLTPDRYLLDIACGSLWLGVRVIPYLEKGHYLGIEKEPGLEQELDQPVRPEKEAHIVIPGAFEFSWLEQKANLPWLSFCLAICLWGGINHCFRNLHPCLAQGGTFYATYFEVSTPRKNLGTPHDYGYFAYTKEEMLAFGEDNGYQTNYIGDWNHSRNQRVVEYRKA